MKKVNFLLTALSIILMASCTSVSEKAQGNYNGTYAFMTSIGGTAEITSATGNTINIVMDVPSSSFHVMVNGINVATSNDNVIFTYDSGTTVDGDVATFNGTLTGNTLSFTVYVYHASGNAYYSFNGTK